MKKITTTLLSLFMATGLLSANDYTPLVREGVKWHCRMDVVSAITETESYPYTIELKGDTVINGVAYKKCYYIFEDASYNRKNEMYNFLKRNVPKKYFLGNKYIYSESGHGICGRFCFCGGS